MCFLPTPLPSAVIHLRRGETTLPEFIQTHHTFGSQVADLIIQRVPGPHQISYRWLKLSWDALVFCDYGMECCT